ncbi:hypothetical protein BGX38DRAFT_1146610 [Terfezia claveryi]|nr:hypothetical protein BGX38DRAFT_1146610 [Terfezia claveryi]
MREKNIAQWVTEVPHIPDEIRTILYPTILTSTFLAHNYPQSSDLESDITRLQYTPVEVFNTLQVAVPTFNDDRNILHHLRYTGGNNNTYYLAHVSLMTVVGSSTLDSPDCMVHVGLPKKNQVIRVVDIEGMAYLILIHD